VGLWIPQGFVVGYGIDYAEEHRELPDIRAVPDT
jgi:hypoxanthine-guanine phosphoribosyltransferase